MIEAANYAGNGTFADAVAYSPDGRLLAFADQDGVRLWNVRTTGTPSDSSAAARSSR